MKTRMGVVCVALAVACAVVCHVTTSFATTFQLALSVDTTTSTWTVTALASDAQQMGLASWSIDVDGSGVNIIKAAVASQTNQTPAGVFSELRTTGTISGSDLTGIQVSQDTFDAVDDNDDSGASGGTALVYGYGFNGIAIGQYASNNYGTPGPVTGLGPITLAMGRYTGTPNIGSNITAQVTPGAYFAFLPLNWDPDDRPTEPGGTTGTVLATAVYPALGLEYIPEPASMVLLGLGGLGLAAASRRRRSTRAG